MSECHYTQKVIIKYTNIRTYIICAIENPVQIVCHHYYYLTKSMDPTEILRTSFFKTLLRNHELNILSQFSLDYMKNVYIMEHIRVLETPDLFLFIDAIQEIDNQKAICDTLLDGTCVSLLSQPVAQCSVHVCVLTKSKYMITNAVMYK